MAQMRSAVVAGSKGFVDAVQGHIKMRFGAAPRVARDPAEALRAFADDGGLLVLEYAGSPWLEAVKSLRGSRGDAGLSIVAAVPLGQVSDVQPLQRAGVDEVVSWQGRVDPVIWAVDRIVERQSARQNATPLPVPEATAESETGFVLREIPSADARAGQESRPPSGTPLATPVPVVPRAVANPASTPSAVSWPDALPSSAAAEAILLGAAAGQRAGNGGEFAAAERVLATASELERAAFAGAEIPVDPAVLRSVAAMRLRLDVALSTVPADGPAVNHAAAQRLLAEVDSVLEQLKALASSAPAGVAPALEPIRLTLVDEGVKLSGAVSALAPAGEARPAAPAPAPGKPPSARVLSNEQDVVVARRRPLASWIALTAALLVAAAYHGRSLLKPAQAPRASIPGAPANTAGMVRGGVGAFTALPGKTIDAAELERLKAAEKAKGNMVKEVAPGTYKIVPERLEGPSSSRGGP